MSKSKNSSKSRTSSGQKYEDSWELAGKELLFPKNKLNFTEEELIRLKKLIIISPPPIEYRKIVRKKLKPLTFIN
jgi:hypothetical protein